MSEATPAVGRRSATLEDVAREAGVSRATVSRVVNGVRNVDPAIQEAVRRAVASTGYTPNSAARSLVTRRPDTPRRAATVALVVTGAGEDSPEGPGAAVFTDPFFGRVVSGVFAALRPHGMHPVLMLADTPASREQVVSYLHEGGADGALVVTTHAEDALPAALLASGRPAVLFGAPDAALPLSYVDLANRDGARLAADHLAARGCRRVVTIAGPSGVQAGRDRLAGFRDAMARHGHPFTPAVEADFTHAGGERAMARLLAEEPDLDGVFAANDLMARGALAVLAEHGRRVPEDVAVVGFDDSSAALSGRPWLTTVRQPVERMAEEMTRILLTRLADPAARPTCVIFEPELVVRQSA
ncbi:LacI family DNA-binding transcriptional regulator [Kitasatospora sp. NPDC048365]|uniref:LacI family DNA-binding transcriptional regulator n=1 Tax=Kitasatospora sp. NPDC048365 TaxID=3364050 RepID=UPI0037123462